MNIEEIHFYVGQKRKQRKNTQWIIKAPRDTLCSSSLSITPLLYITASSISVGAFFFFVSALEINLATREGWRKNHPSDDALHTQRPSGKLSFLTLSLSLSLFFLYCYGYRSLFFTAFAARTFLHFLLHPQAFQKRMAN